jgi:hypothetical protein
MSTHHDDEHVGVAPAVAAFAALFAFGIIARYWIWALAIAAITVAFVALLSRAFYAARRVDAKRAARAALVARADQQQAWVLAGDDPGTYGDYWPKQSD